MTLALYSDELWERYEREVVRKTFVLTDSDKRKLDKIETSLLGIWNYIISSTPSLSSTPLENFDDKFFIAGGVIANLFDYYYTPRLTTEYKDIFPGSDIDIFVNTESKRGCHTAAYPILKRFKNNLYNNINDYFKIRHGVSKRSYTLHFDNAMVNHIQIVKYRHGTPEDVVKSFDYEHLSNAYYTKKTGLVLLSDYVVPLWKEKILVNNSEKLNRPKDGNENSRLNKWISRGYKVDPKIGNDKDKLMEYLVENYRKTLILSKKETDD